MPAIAAPSQPSVDLDALERDGYAVVRAALSAEEVAVLRGRLMAARERGWEDGLNDEGNMWFDSLLDREPETFARLIGHRAVRPYLEGMLGRQCQLRGLRAHINPGVYRQTWHMDFHGYWQELRANAGRRLAVQPVGLNTTFYFDDNAPGRAGLSFIPGLDLRLAEEDTRRSAALGTSSDWAIGKPDRRTTRLTIPQRMRARRRFFPDRTPHRRPGLLLRQPTNRYFSLACGPRRRASAMDRTTRPP